MTIKEDNADDVDAAGCYNDSKDEAVKNNELSSSDFKLDNDSPSKVYTAQPNEQKIDTIAAVKNEDEEDEEKYSEVDDEIENASIKEMQLKESSSASIVEKTDNLMGDS